jgi:pSer/pThr/pTyr-binding forkhead associated (FHA) protein
MYRITSKSFDICQTEEIETFRMPEEKILTTKKSFSLDWLVRGVLAKVGDIFDSLTGRRWKPSSSLATSEIIERLKLLLDAEVKQEGEFAGYVPHNIKLKMQWDKFSTDAEEALGKLEKELLIAAVDHINDRRYYTYAPIKIEITPDYFTEGVKLLVSFDKFADDEGEAAINVSMPDLKNVVINPQTEAEAEPEKEIYTAEFNIKGKQIKKELAFSEQQRLSIGRTKENDLWLDDESVSKIHASLVLNSSKQLMVADTGSTNGTFINDRRIEYAKAFVLKDGDKLKFGTVEVDLKYIPNETEEEVTKVKSESASDGERRISDAPPDVSFEEESSANSNLTTVSDLKFTDDSQSFEKLNQNNLKSVLDIDDKK